MTSTINGTPLDEVAGDGNKSNELDIDTDKFLLDGRVEAGNRINLSKVSFFTDFLGDAADLADEPLIVETEGSGTGNAVTGATSDAGGTIDILTSSADAAFTANASAIQVDGLNWKANMGGLVMEAKLQVSDVSEAYVFVGFTDALPSAGLEAPVFLNAANIDSDATDACGVFFDKDGTTGDQWCHGGVKADTDTTPAYAGYSVADATDYIVRVEVSSAGAVQGFVDGNPIGAAVANAVTATTALCPVIVVANRSANAVTATVDYLLVQADRA